MHVLPKPQQPTGIPIWIGGHTEAALRRAATLGDGWHPIGLRPPVALRPDEYATRVKQLYFWAQQAGRDPAAIALTLRVPMDIRSPRDKAPAGDRPLFQGPAAEVIADIRRYQGLGVRHIVFDAVRPDPQAVLANLERFAEEVRPQIPRNPK
jgi:alkanesulfonate monooxygenase SsuD/methylene tetrahydromethanopterin reductase-like flavin-dependent oxidoreductase (luciferase family)